MSGYTVVASNTVNISSYEMPALYCDCDDERLSAHGLSCRLDCAIEDFFKNRTQPWMFIGGDDDWINLDALHRVVRNKGKHIDPYTEIDFMGNLQQMNEMSFPHGGPGFIMSRGFIKQFMTKRLSVERISRRGKWVTDDVAMGIVLNDFFSDVLFWSNPLSAVTLPNAKVMKEIENSNWNTIPLCHPDIFRPSVRDVYCVHTTPFSSRSYAALNNLREAPLDIRIVGERYTHYSLCKCQNYGCASLPRRISAIIGLL